MSYILISYATNDSQYLKYAETFVQNLNKLKINKYFIDLLEVPKNLNYWNNELNDVKVKKELICLQKPALILKYLQKYKTTIVCVDIDSILIRKPVIFEDCDIGLIFRPNRLLSISNGLHFYNYTSNSIRFLEMWNYLCKYPELTYLSDHHRLSSITDWIRFENKIIKDKIKIKNIYNEYKSIYIEGLTRQNKTVTRQVLK